MTKQLFFFIIFALYFSFPVQATSLPSVMLNEIAWMGTETSANDEWIELYNNTTSDISLDGWILKADDGKPEIELNGTIAANSYYILERTDDTTIPDITADLIYTGALSNKGESLKLYNNYGDLIDTADYKNGWITGDNSTKQTMERTPTGWITSKDSGGTPAEETSAPQENTIQQVIEYPLGIIFTEILPSPEGPDKEEEWIEIFNENDFAVDLSDWQIRDSVGKITTYTFPEKTTIASKEYFVLCRIETKIILNNSGDALILLNPDGEVIDSVLFEKTIRGESYNKTSSGWKWSAVITPGKENIIPIAKTPKNQELNAAVPATNHRNKTAALSTSSLEHNTATNHSAWQIALILAIFSGTVILILKKELAMPS